MRIAIVGAGISGLCTAWALTKRGHHVTLIEQGASIPNPLSASGDQHRLIRRAYGGADGYARLITEAFGAWDEMWADLGVSHYAERGVLIVSQAPGDQADGLKDGLDRVGSAYTFMDAAAAAGRYPFLDAASIRYAVLSPEGGVLLCQRIAAGLVAFLQQHGAVLMPGTTVTAVDAEAGTIAIADGASVVFDRVVVTAGAWVLRLFPEFAPVLNPYRTAVVYLEPPADLRQAWAEAPAILDIGGAIDGYVVPPVDGTGLKFGAGVGLHKRKTSDPDTERAREAGEGERLRDSFSPAIARIDAYKVTDVVTCVYTFTDDERFFAAGRGKTIIVSACSGHGYKFGAAIGRRVADAVESGDAETLARWMRAELAV